MTYRDVREICWQGLVIEGYLLKLRGIELLCQKDRTNAFIKGTIRQVAIREELDRRRIQKWRAM